MTLFYKGQFMTKSTNERRKFTRIPFEASVTLSNQEGSWTAKLLDISLNGALISQPHNWKPGTSATFLLDINAPDDVFDIRMETTITHTGESNIGLQCDHIDIDSVSHLRRLVELNVGNEDILNRELSTLINQAA